MKNLTLLLFCFLTLTFCKQKSEPIDNRIVITNGTILDFSNLGKRKKDLPNTYIILENGLISKTGSMDENPNFGNAKIIDAKGKIIIPGLIDGFAAINNQSYANAYLYSGVTDIISVSGGRRGDFFGTGNPSPNIHVLDGIGDEKISDEKLLSGIDSLNDLNVSVILLMYGLTPSQLKLALERTRKYNMVTIGELGYSTYKEGIKLGINAFVHTTRYSLDIAPKEMARKVADEPFSNDLKSPKWKYYNYLSNISMDDEQLNNHAQTLGSSDIFIQPTLSLLYLDMELNANPWDEKVASIIDPNDVDAPANKATGKHDYDSITQAAYTAIAKNVLNIESLYYQNGAKYLAGSATDVWGTMPGISLLTELELLSKIGLTNREVLASATENFNLAYGWKQGKIKAGFSANILILDKNPLDDLSHLKQINTLILNGEIINRDSLGIR